MLLSAVNMFEIRRTILKRLFIIILFLNVNSSVFSERCIQFVKNIFSRFYDRSAKGRRYRFCLKISNS